MAVWGASGVRCQKRKGRKDSCPLGFCIVGALQDDDENDSIRDDSEDNG